MDIAMMFGPEVHRTVALFLQMIRVGRIHTGESSRVLDGGRWRNLSWRGRSEELAASTVVLKGLEICINWKVPAQSKRNKVEA